MAHYSSLPRGRHDQLFINWWVDQPKIVYSYNGILVRHKNELVISRTWVNLENIMWSGGSQSQKDTCCMALCLPHEPKRQIRGDGKPDSQFPEALGRRGRRLMGVRFLSRVLKGSGITRQWRLHSLRNILKTLNCALFKRVNVIICCFFSIRWKLWEHPLLAVFPSRSHAPLCYSFLGTLATETTSISLILSGLDLEGMQIQTNPA